MKKILKEKLMKSSLTKRKKDEVLTKLELDAIKDENYVKIMTDLGFRRFGNTTEFYVNFK